MPIMTNFQTESFSCRNSEASDFVYELVTSSTIPNDNSNLAMNNDQSVNQKFLQCKRKKSKDRNDHRS